MATPVKRITLPCQSNLLDLHMLSMHCLSHVHGRRSLVGQVERATTNAVMGFNQACSRYRLRHHLHRTQSMLQICVTGYEMLCVEGFIHERVYDEIRRRVDQLAEAVKQLELLPVEEWAQCPLPALAALSTHGTRKQPSAIQESIRRVAAIVKALGAVTPVEPPQLPAEENGSNVPS